jgi:Tol biopolymer transport system component
VPGPTVAFSATHTGGASVDIYAVTPVGEVVPLTDDGKSSAPAFTLDGTSLVFARAATREGSAGGPPPATSVWRMDADGSNQREIMQVPVVETPNYSPDGSELVFSGVADEKERELGYRIHMASIDGTDIRRLTDSQRGDLIYVSEHEPVWSPDGSSIAFVRVGDTAAKTVSQLWLLELQSGLETLLHETSQGSLFDLAWAPSGEALLFSVSEGATDGRIAVSIDIPTRELTRLAGPVGSPGYSAVDPDRIVYFSPLREDGQLQLVEVIVGGEATRILLRGPEVVPTTRIVVQPCKLTS